MNRICAALRRERRKAGWSQDRLAEAANKPKHTLVDLELGRTKATQLETVDQLLRPLGLKLAVIRDPKAGS